MRHSSGPSTRGISQSLMMTSAPCSPNSRQASSPSRASVTWCPWRWMRSWRRSRMPASSSAMSTRIRIRSLPFARYAGHVVGDLAQIGDAIRLGDHLVDAALSRFGRVDGGSPASYQNEACGGPALAYRLRQVPAVLAWPQAEAGHDQSKGLLPEIDQRLLDRCRH